jgi:hypothetical protein
MLTVIISYHTKNISEFSFILKGTETENGWKVPLKDRKNDVYIVHEKNKQQLVFSFANHLSFEQYQQIHHLITRIHTPVNASCRKRNRIYRRRYLDCANTVNVY